MTKFDDWDDAKVDDGGWKIDRLASSTAAGRPAASERYPRAATEMHTWIELRKCKGMDGKQYASPKRWKIMCVRCHWHQLQVTVGANGTDCANGDKRMRSTRIERWMWLCSGNHLFSQSRYTPRLVFIHSSVRGVLGSKASMLTSFTSQLVRLNLICWMNSLNECSVRIALILLIHVHALNGGSLLLMWFHYWTTIIRKFKCSCKQYAYCIQFPCLSYFRNILNLICEKWGRHRKNLFLYLRCAIWL